MYLLSIGKKSLLLQNDDEYYTSYIPKEEGVYDSVFKIVIQSNCMSSRHSPRQTQVVISQM